MWVIDGFTYWVIPEWPQAPRGVAWRGGGSMKSRSYLWPYRVEDVRQHSPVMLLDLDWRLGLQTGLG